MITGTKYHTIPDSQTSYPKYLIRSKDLLNKLTNNDLLKTKFYEKITTYFVKVSRWEIEHIYEGHISDLSVMEKDNKTYFSFKVHLEREIKKDEYDSHLFFVDMLRPILRSGECPDSGWYYQEYSILPSFFKVLKETKDRDKFEDFTYYPLKLIGINDIYKYERTKQAGLPDGIFKIGNLVVMYDATLNEQLDQKRQQISNYINTLIRDTIKVSEPQNITWDIRNFSKRVWIITRYKMEKFKPEQLDDVKVRIITIDDLFEIYEERLKGEINDEETLKKRLENL